MQENITKAWTFAQYDDVESLKSLVPSQVDVNASTKSPDNHVHTLLMSACAHGSVACAKYLIDGGAVVDKRNFMGYTAPTGPRSAGARSASRCS